MRATKKISNFDIDNLLTKMRISDMLRISVRTVERMQDDGLLFFPLRNKLYTQYDLLHAFIQSEIGTNETIDLYNLVTHFEIAEKLGVSVKTVERMRIEGMPLFKFRQVFYIEKKKLEAYLLKLMKLKNVASSGDQLRFAEAGVA